MFRGAHGVAPELGHLRVVPDGRPCPCGKRGCWERYCSGTALAETAVELLAATAPVHGAGRRVAGGDSPPTGRRVAAAARDGDPLACAAMADLARWLGEGLALVADVYDPEVVVIGGGVSESAPLFLDDAREHYAAIVTGAGHRPLARIRTAQLGEAAAVVGAAELARESWTPADQGRSGAQGDQLGPVALDRRASRRPPSEHRAVVLPVAVAARGAVGHSRSTSQASPDASATRPSGSA